MEPQRISPDEVKRRMDTGEHVVFVDTRSAGAWRDATSQLPHSIRVSPDAVDADLGAIPRRGLIVTYCT